jgi:hypothetical protein
MASEHLREYLVTGGLVLFGAALYWLLDELRLNVIGAMIWVIFACCVAFFIFAVLDNSGLL